MAACAYCGPAAKSDDARDDGAARPEFRTWGDQVMWSNAAYLVASGCAAGLGVWDVAVLLVFVTGGSSLYHLHAERSHLWLDALFASALFVMAVVALFDAVQKQHWAYIGGCALGFPLLIFLFVASDLPESKNYAFYHILWHYATAFGTVMVAMYIASETTQKLSFELFTWEAAKYGMGFVLLCLLAMRDTIERTFFTNLRSTLKGRTDVVVTNENEVIVAGHHFSHWWFWVGYALQLAGVFAVYSLGWKELTLLLAGAMCTAFTYHALFAHCDLVLDLTLGAVALLAVAGVFFQLSGYESSADWAILMGIVTLPCLFSWVTLSSAMRKRLIAGLDVRVSHAIITACNATAAMMAWASRDLLFSYATAK
ncbi:Hypothetical Protein FCC1311_071492 [Hondaea fermentalgiana]|uniref:Transmembrane protein n=1 Tax=Hondaea fermentalgiana TaxID=2315210 RepID=A0A2R5GMG3_9STRA|nr:Hypothetical Protein FCC1311_071492 [Hondaea fermentalgiana]|eukprot:GBG30928.1 Hypothetical Protein FCC1311_071492 [Hondaea fermentalgiana]